MPKTGETRSDGKVFLSYHKKSKNGERWVTMEKFLKSKGSDWYERRATMDKNVAERAKKKEKAAQKRIEMESTKDQRDKERKEKKEDYARRYYKEVMYQKRLQNPERYREIDRRHHAKRKNDPDYIRRCREAARRCYLKKNSARIEAKKEARAAKEKEKQERSKKRIEAREAAKALKLAILAAKPKRIVLTEEQRKERKRQEKRNYKHTRRARINNCEVKATPQMVEDARKAAGDRCYYCGKKSELTLDHFEPLANGGAHCVSNFVFACFSCNSKKRDLDPFDFMASNVASWL